MDILLPRTDGGVLVQLLVLLAAGSAAVWWLRRRREVQLIAIGVTLVALGLMGVRALH